MRFACAVIQFVNLVGGDPLVQEASSLLHLRKTDKMNVRLEDDLDFSTICTLPKSNNVNAKRKLRLECRDGECFDVSFAVAKMSPKLREMIHRRCCRAFESILINAVGYAHTIGPQGIFSVNIGDLPSRGVFHALAYCR